MKKHWNWQFGKLVRAVGVLVTNTGDVRNRVWVASEYLFQITPRAVPPECRDDIEWIQWMMTRHPKEQWDKSDMDATYRRTRNSTASKIAERIWKVYHVYESALDEESRQAKDRPFGIVIVPPKKPSSRRQS